MSAPSLIPIRNSGRPGDIAELVTPAELRRRQDAAGAAQPAPAASAAPLMDFGQLPAFGAPSAPKTPAAGAPAVLNPRVRLALMTLAAITLAVALIWLVPAFNRSAADRPAGERLAGPSAPPPTARPTATPAATATAISEPIPVFWGPGGESAGAFDRTQPYTPTARFGADWLSIEVPGGGKVWTHRADVPTVNDQAVAALPDLQSPPTPTAASYIPRATNPPDPGPPCANFGSAGQMVTVCGYGDLTDAGRQKWIETYGGNQGQVFVGITPTPQ